MPILGFGTWQSYGNDTYQSVKWAIEAGYRHIDTALAYENEKEVGRAINEMIQSKIVTRDELFVVTKVWNTYHSKANAIRSVNISLSNLGLKYIDLVLIHWPFGFKEGDQLIPRDDHNKIIFSDIDYLETWQGLEEVHHRGLAKSIGLSNFNSKQLERVFQNSKVKPAINQVIELTKILNLL